MVYNKLFKRLIFFVFLLFILFFMFDKRKVDFNVGDRLYSNNLVYNVSIGGDYCILNLEKNKCYYSSTFDLEKLKIRLSSSYNISYVLQKENLNYYLMIYNDYFYQRIDIVNIDIPIISINSFDLKKMLTNDIYKRLEVNSNGIGCINDNCIELNKSYLVGVKVISSDIQFSNSSFTANFKVRGSSSKSFDKKSYQLEFSEKQSVLGFESDNKLVLDALFVDKSKVRNALSTAIWGLINDNQIIDNDLQCRFVELYVDNEYRGLYVLKDKVDSSVTKIEKNGAIVKAIAAIQDKYIDDLKKNNVKIVDNSFLNYEIKKGNNESINSIILKLHNYYFNNETYDAIENSFDFDNYINYKIFVALVSGNDNTSYNQYYSIVDSDSNILITPWDMDLTWGLIWQIDDNLFNRFDLSSCSDKDWIDKKIIGNMDDKTFIALRDRYWELRESVITMDTINSYLDYYKKILIESGAPKRDSDKWYSYDIDYEIENIRKWACMRIDFLDKYFAV